MIESDAAGRARHACSHGLEGVITKDSNAPHRSGRIGLGEDKVQAVRHGEGLQPNSLTHEFVRILALAPTLPRVRFHDLRHTHATHMLASGIHPKIAQERLGHSTIAITLDLYSHVMPGMQEDAAAKVDAAIREAIDKAANDVR